MVFPLGTCLFLTQPSGLGKTYLLSVLGMAGVFFLKNQFIPYLGTMFDPARTYSPIQVNKA